MDFPAAVETVEPADAAQGNEPPMMKRFWRWRAVDICFLVAGMPFLVVIGAAVGIWTKIVSPGRVLYRQTRIGYQGRKFTIYKFRTMHENASTADHEKHVAELLKSEAKMTKLDARGDARVIPGASLLRKSGLDELPQLINVLRGEMSLVGPRPCLDSEYELHTPAQRERFSVLPGLTGYWQVNGKNNTTFAEMVAMDIHYARNRSIWMDCGIIVKTPWILLVQTLNLGSKVKAPAKRLVSPRISEKSLSVD